MSQQTMSKTAGDAILQMAIQMEDVGRDFYEAIASVTSDSQVRALCSRLATDELGHRKKFQQMHSELARHGRTVFVSDIWLAEYRKLVKKVVLPSPDIVRRMALEWDINALLDVAIEMEKNSMCFYHSFIDGVPDRSVVEDIIEEEQGHLMVLTALRECRK